MNNEADGKEILISTRPYSRFYRLNKLFSNVIITK